MAGSFERKPIWKHSGFTVQKGVLKPKEKLPGTELGYGVFYYPGPHKVRHQVGTKNRIVLGKTDANMRCLWNPGNYTEIVNESAEPADFFRINVRYKPSVEGYLSDDDISAATAYLAHKGWPEGFKSSVKRDLNSIGLLAEPFVFGKEPSSENLLRAQRAKEDLEFKLAWFKAASQKRKFPTYYLVDVSWPSFLRPRPSKDKTPPVDGTINVTVNTKNSDGKDAPGYHVYSNVNLDGKDPETAELFDQISTPTSADLSVGVYWLWAEKGGVSGNAIKKTIGDVNRPLKRTQTVDLTV